MRTTQSYHKSGYHAFMHAFQNKMENFENKFCSVFLKNSNVFNKLQLSSLIFYIRSFPFLPALPFSWSRNENRFVHSNSKIRNGLYAAWILVFEMLLCVAWSLYLLFIEYRLGADLERGKIDKRKSLFLVLFVIGVLASIGYGLTTLLLEREQICLDFQLISRLEYLLRKGKIAKEIKNLKPIIIL